jgi:hypothetical protein
MSINNNAVRIAGTINIILGIVFVLLGTGIWVTASTQLKAEKISVASDADAFAGKTVAGPFTAMAQANVVAKHVEQATSGKTMSEINAEQQAAEKSGDTAKAADLEQLATMAQTGSFTRASLITSVIAFGVAALIAGLGIIQIITGVAFHGLARKKA